MSSLSFIELYAKNVSGVWLSSGDSVGPSGRWIVRVCCALPPRSRTQCWTNRSGLAERADDNKRDFEER